MKDNEHNANKYMGQSSDAIKQDNLRYRNRSYIGSDNQRKNQLSAKIFSRYVRPAIIIFICSLLYIALNAFTK